MIKINRDYFRNWNYKKHAKFCTCVYLVLYAFDMTVSYPIVKTILNRVDEREDELVAGASEYVAEGAAAVMDEIADELEDAVEEAEAAAEA